MSALLVEVKPELLGLLCHVGQALEQGRVEELRSDTAVVAFADGVVDGLSGATEERLDVVLLPPAGELVGDELRPVVRAELAWRPPRLSP